MNASMDDKIKRINELYHLSKERTLTEDELNEQKALRQDYINSVRSNLRAQLNNIDIVNADGTVIRPTDAPVRRIR